MKTIILVGFMGAGKTAVGRRLANQLGIEFLDTDELIEKKEKRKITDIFAEDGEEYFRKAETAAVKELAKEKKLCVLSCGGGLAVREENRRILKELGTTVYIRVSPETVMERLKGNKTRPLLQGEDPQGKIRKLMTQREEYYNAAADLTVPIEKENVEEAAELIISQLNRIWTEEINK